MLPPRRILVAGAALVLAVGLGSSATTGALWQQTQPLGAGSLSSGSLVLLNGSATTQVHDYAFTALAGTNLAPGRADQAPLTIRNGGTVQLAYRLSNTQPTAPLVGAGLLLTADVVSSAASCPTGVGAGPPTGTTTRLYSGPLPGASFPSLRTVPVAGTDTLCLRVSVAASAPSTIQGSSTQVTFTFAAVQA